MTPQLFSITLGSGSIVTAAIHDGHAIRREVADLFALDEEILLREKDPYTAELAEVSDTRIIGLRSRFEVDLNRPRDQAMYLTEENSWGLNVWEEPPPAGAIKRSLDEYDEFYRAVESTLETVYELYGPFVVLDIHSYNHRRGGPDAEPAPAEENPEINIGTGSMDRERWGTVVDRFLSDLRDFDFQGRSLDVRENVKFRGGYFSQWIHERFPRTGCAIAIEFKKTFMDEWTGELNRPVFDALKEALRSTLPGLRETLEEPQVSRV